MIHLDTIVAVATPHGSSALAVIRCCGPQAFQLTAGFVKNKERFLKAEEKKIGLYKILDTAEQTIIDEVTILKYEASHSFNGEEMVEIMCHGSILIIEKIIEAYTRNGVRYARGGEFTKRAFINGKKTLLQAESINQIIQAETALQQSNALAQYQGSVQKKIKAWKEEIISISAHIEASIEFGEHDNIDKKNFVNECFNEIEKIKNEILKELEKHSTILQKEKGIRCALIGPPNAGKSTLLNLIVGFNRSIVHHLSGTTRDFVTETVAFNNRTTTFIDTAGIRKTDDPIERIGIEQTNKIISSATLILWITAANEKCSNEEMQYLQNFRSPRSKSNVKIVGIINKGDCSNPQIDKEKIFKSFEIPSITITAIASDDIHRKEIINFITTHLETIETTFEGSCCITTNRQRQILTEIIHEIEQCEKNAMSEELIAFHLKNIHQKMDEYDGTHIDDDIVDKIFNEFCIGK
ncbi:MAG: tRNA uridine-5-carboxymethylaminomethyl(34) synthesis GTPase MnmE [Chitinivibrionales bacterium]|nr:tRNA uridine-5-carboxymethylaminomethyl(34) synthesis GTPase MnmE [Chitinivibrionales bacterium]